MGEYKPARGPASFHASERRQKSRHWAGFLVIPTARRQRDDFRAPFFRDDLRADFRPPFFAAPRFDAPFLELFLPADFLPPFFLLAMGHGLHFWNESLNRSPGGSVSWRSLIVTRSPCTASIEAREARNATNGVLLVATDVIEC